MIVTQTQLARTEVDRPTSGDRLFHATLGRFTAGVSPASLGLAYADWAFHLAASPGKWQQLGEKAARKAVRLATYAGRPVATPPLHTASSRCRRITASAPRRGGVGPTTSDQNNELTLDSGQIFYA